MGLGKAGFVLCWVFAPFIFALPRSHVHHTNNTAISNQQDCSSYHFDPAQQELRLSQVQTSNSSFGMSFLQEELQEPTRIPMGSKMKLSCQCLDAVRVPSNLKLSMEIPFGVCGATEVKVVTDQEGTGMSEDDVRTVAGNPLYLKWALINSHHFSDWEPRTDAAILGTPGGDIVEFINMLDVYEDEYGAQFHFWHCTWLLHHYLDRTKKISFYMATDTSALRALMAYTNTPGLDIRRRPRDNFWNLMRAVILPEHNGCRVLRLMLEQPEQFNVRKGLVEGVIMGFFYILWDKWQLTGKKLRIVELDRTPTTLKGVIRVKTSDACLERGLSPLFAPVKGDFKMFVAHLDAANFFRKELSTYMATLNSRIDPTSYLDKMKANGEKYLGVVTSAYATGLPIYDLHYV